MILFKKKYSVNQKYNFKIIKELHDKIGTFIDATGEVSFENVDEYIFRECEQWFYKIENNFENFEKYKANRIYNYFGIFPIDIKFEYPKKVIFSIDHISEPSYTDWFTMESEKCTHQVY